ncbi:cytochrome P450 [Haloarcula sp. JP-L23]|uniref:cytochrome P450 n=1 Tax=Haloarcula sp. JP-L23 TaxID=2716717 RepID=UPI00140F0C52|nr:cytochrome P450 [Haloarcula sp. JP-L23]
MESVSRDSTSHRVRRYQHRHGWLIATRGGTTAQTRSARRLTDAFRAALPRLAYFPIDAGARRCVGARFALMETTLFPASLYQDYHLELYPETTFEVESVINTRPKSPARMIVQSR